MDRVIVFSATDLIPALKPRKTINAQANMFMLWLAQSKKEVTLSINHSSDTIKLTIESSLNATNQNFKIYG